MVTSISTSYTPTLKWRMGAYQALEKLDGSVKDRVVPLLELIGDQQDFETGSDLKTLESRLEPFGKRLKSKWANRTCFVDSCFDDAARIERSGEHHLVYAFEQAREYKTSPIPVVSPQRNRIYVGAVREIVQRDERGVALRVSIPVIGDSELNLVTGLLSALKLDIKDAHLILDAGSVESVSPSVLAMHWERTLAAVPSPSLWQSITILAGSFPKSLPSALFRPANTAPRVEWDAYQLLVQRLRIAGLRVPRYGDYATTPPESQEINLRVIDPTAKIRYTLDNDWHIAVGAQIRRHGREQLRPMCQTLIKTLERRFMGAPYSYGDAYILECANGGSTGGASTFNTVAYNHHITHSVRQLAKLSGV